MIFHPRFNLGLPVFSVVDNDLVVFILAVHEIIFHKNLDTASSFKCSVRLSWYGEIGF